jgi:hypothetical protein
MALANYFVIYDRQSAGKGNPGDERKFQKGKILSEQETARVVKVEAESVKEAQEISREAFPANGSTTPVVIAEAAYKES